MRVVKKFLDPKPQATVFHPLPEVTDAVACGFGSNMIPGVPYVEPS
jgi:hypothetical protein